MGSKTIKTALVVGAIATGFAAIPAIGSSTLATSVGGFVAPSLAGTKAAGLIGTFIVSPEVNGKGGSYSFFSSAIS